MENTTENKLRFFANYFGQKVLKNDKYNELSFLTGFFFFHNATYIKNYHLELRSIESITDEECIEVLSYNCNYNQLEILKVKRYKNAISIDFRFISDKVNNNDGFTYCGDTFYFDQVCEKLDLLRSKGFLVPFMNLTTDQIIQFGWAKIKDNE